MRCRAKYLFVIAMGFIIFFTTNNHTYAGFWENISNGYDQLTSLPKEVTKLQENYDKTMTELNRTKESVEAFQTKNEELFKLNENLVEQNQDLIKRNQELTLAVNELKKIEQEKELTKAKTINVVWVIVFLILGYFILIRIIRFFMRLSSRKR